MCLTPRTCRKQVDVSGATCAGELRAEPKFFLFPLNTAGFSSLPTNLTLPPPQGTMSVHHRRPTVADISLPPPSFSSDHTEDPESTGSHPPTLLIPPTRPAGPPLPAPPTPPPPPPHPHTPTPPYLPKASLARLGVPHPPSSSASPSHTTGAATPPGTTISPDAGNPTMPQVDKWSTAPEAPCHIRTAQEPKNHLRLAHRLERADRP